MDYPIIQMYELNKFGERGGLIDHDPSDKNQLLGVLLEVEEIGDTLAGQFYTWGLSTKTARVEISSSDCMEDGTLIKFNRNEYNKKLQTSFGEQFSKASFKCLDKSQFYEGFCFKDNSKTFWTKLVNFKLSDFDCDDQQDFAWSFPHFIFGNIRFDSFGKVIGPDKRKYRSITVESNILTDSYNGMYFIIKHQEEKSQRSSEKVLVEGRKNGEASDMSMAEKETFQVDVMAKVDKKTGNPGAFKTAENVVDTPNSSTNQTGINGKIVGVHEAKKSQHDATTGRKHFTDEKQIKNATIKSTIPSEADIVHRKTTEAEKKPSTSENQDTVNEHTIDEEKNENKIGYSISNATENKELIIDPNDQDTIYGIIWKYVVEEEHAHIFCIHLEKNFGIVKIPIGQQIPVGELVKFSKTEFKKKFLKKEPGKDVVSTVTVTHVPNHGLFQIKIRNKNRHEVTLHNYTISTHTEKPDKYEFYHVLFGTIEDKTRTIQDVKYDKIELSVTKRTDSCKGMKFTIHDVFEKAIMTEAEKEWRQLPMNVRSERLANFLRIRQESNMDKARRKWNAVGTLTVKKVESLGGIEGDAPFFKADRYSPLIGTIIKNNYVCVYLVEPDFNGDMFENLPSGVVRQHNNGFHFIPTKKYKDMVFEVGNKYKFLPKSIEKVAEYYEENQHMENNLFQLVHFPPKSEEVDSEKLKDMYTSEVISEDPELLGDEFILNKKQKQAVRMALNESRKIVLIHGPPGTGKTHTLAELIFQYVLRKQKILVIAPTNYAIQNVYEVTSKLLVARGVFRNEDGMPLLITHETFLKETKNCGLTEGLEELEQQLKENVIDIDDYKQKKSEMISCVMRKFVENALVCFCTTLNSFVHLVKQHGFETQTALVDEAGMVLEAHLWSALHSMSRIIMAGDPKQLPALVKFNPRTSTPTEIANFQMSAMERLMLDYKENPNYIMLIIQYRMHPAIMQIASRMFYGEELQADESVENIQVRDLINNGFKVKLNGHEELRKPVVFCDTATSERKSDISRYCFDKRVYLNREQDGDQRPSYSNPGEAVLVMKYLVMLLNNNVNLTDISIITPYEGQVVEIQELLNKRRDTENIKVGTIDSFQGKENEVVIVSLVRNNPKRSVGFLIDEKRFNVLVTRAKRQLFLIGHSSSFLFNNRGFLPQFSEILISTNSVVSRVRLNNVDKPWENEQVDKFGGHFKDYLKFNPEDKKMKLFIDLFLENRNADLAAQYDDDDDEE